MSDPTTLEFPRGTLPPPAGEPVTPEGDRPIAWRLFPPTSVRLVVYARSLDTGRVLAFARDVSSIFAEGGTAKAALREIRGVARQIVAVYRARGLPIPFEDVEREDGDELIGSFVIDA